MAAVSFENIMKQLKDRKFAPIYLLMGEEPFYIDQISNYIENNAIPEEDRDFNQVVLYGKDTNSSEVVSNAKQFSFGSEYHVVIVKEAKDMKDIELMQSYFKNPLKSTILVICHKYGKLKASAYKGCDAETVIFDSVPVKDYALSAWVEKCAVENGYKISSEAAQIITEHVGNDLSRIDNEFKKLKIFVPQGTQITPDIVEKNIGISKEYNVFELQDALGDRNTEKATKICMHFVNNIKDNPNVMTISSLNLFYSKMLAYHLLPDKSPENLAKIYGSNSYIQKINVAKAQKHNLPQLMKIISVLREYDAKTKGVDNAATDEELLKEMVYKILH